MANSLTCVEYLDKKKLRNFHLALLVAFPPLYYLLLPPPPPGHTVKEAEFTWKVRPTQHSAEFYISEMTSSIQDRESVDFSFGNGGKDVSSGR